MEIKKAAMAGTLESSDAQVTVEPGNGTIELSIESSVIHQFGKQIRATVLETLGRLEVGSAKVTVVDKGALDCTLKARVECAVYRSNDMTEDLPWGGVIR
ncbi:MAG: citrate lyase acyl carrier protein [Lachnospiraceae bacterium]|nr:citrate lyase acyl carrier protein [Lachnospiraceae bacterium]